MCVAVVAHTVCDLTLTRTVISCVSLSSLMLLNPRASPSLPIQYVVVFLPRAIIAYALPSSLVPSLLVHRHAVIAHASPSSLMCHHCHSCHYCSCVAVIAHAVSTVIAHAVVAVITHAVMARVAVVTHAVIAHASLSLHAPSSLVQSSLMCRHHHSCVTIVAHAVIAHVSLSLLMLSSLVRCCCRSHCHCCRCSRCHCLCSHCSCITVAAHAAFAETDGITVPLCGGIRVGGRTY